MNSDMWISQKKGNIIKAVKLTKIFDPEEEKEKAAKALKLNDYDHTVNHVLLLSPSCLNQ
jgi:hypothetical protein